MRSAPPRTTLRLTSGPLRTSGRAGAATTASVRAYAGAPAHESPLDPPRRRQRADPVGPGAGRAGGPPRHDLLGPCDRRDGAPRPRRRADGLPDVGRALAA